MSAICGIVGPVGAVTEPLLSRLRDAMVLHDPQQQGLHVSRDRRAGLGHVCRHTGGGARSALRPLSNEDGTVWAIAAGDIFNASDLRKSLETTGHAFRSCDDAEVIVHLYEDRGEAFPSELDGEFAIALWDQNNGVCCLVRDRIGRRTLHYAWDGSRLIFASEMKAIARHPDIGAETDPVALDDYLSLGYVPCPRTILRGVRKVRPAHILRYENAQVSSRAYWSPLPEPNAGYKEDRLHQAAVYEQILSSLQKRSASDDSAGVLLSGGLVSSSLVGLLGITGSRKVRTFSIGLTGQEDQDVLFAGRVSNRFDTNHESILLEPQPAGDLIPGMARMLDGPIATVEGLPLYLISTALQGRIGVCISGEGGRELFGDPVRHRLGLRRMGLLESVQLGNEALDGPLQDALSPSLHDYVIQTSVFTAEEKRRLLHTDWNVPVEKRREDDRFPFRNEFLLSGREGFFEKLQGADLHTRLPDGILATIDRAGVFASLDLRLPLLDPTLVRTALALPLHLKTTGGIDKYVLRKAMAGVLPEEVLWRPSRSFSFPLTRLFSRGLEDHSRDVLLGGGSKLFRRSTLHALLRGNWTENPLAFSKIWTLVMFEEWRRALQP